MDDALRPKPTWYKGYYFRSRLEARHAVFFDCLHVEWRYEEEKYLLADGTVYIPDYHLPQHHCWIEIKGKPPTKEEVRKCQLLALASNEPVYLFHSNIWMPDVDDRVDVYYDNEKLFKKGVFLKGAYCYDPAALSLYARDTASPCYKAGWSHGRCNGCGKGRCASQLEIYPPGSLEDQHYGTIHLSAEQGYLLRVIYIADILHSAGDSCTFQLDQQGRLQFLVPVYHKRESAVSGKRWEFAGRQHTPLPALVQQHKQELEYLLSRRARTWEWSIGMTAGMIYTEDTYRWCECPHCHAFGITDVGNANALPCYQSHNEEFLGVVEGDGFRALTYNTPDLLAAHEAARSARFEER